ncbi:MAG: phytanoyl-CoA dioxygenase [Gemmatimonadetes bacterium]|jgi:ectoine hydroxylase-related dioxygenase (phytanoyl-CoA dioxygenase family)|nr:phytanoyl-CoA dioxygenase [Gemmatimonadota bacterium]MBT5056231.1 phytanoyl-CoA dioxygenase [Gemmatimonadota bacterium]MBT5146314.1 phytanoyl-CoA dioxygenase [Gemmatimonadota bacterium]MBT5591237.1 phytanoyl-CoA dioxygenase [Gemmatimonadota bacterium]MBT5962308.1 phytanoyl-CoA dioxygenase [Gemmatimonadota bacterium]
MDPRLIDLGLEPTALDAENARELDEQGYTILQGIINPTWLAGLRDAFEQVCQTEGTDAGKEVAQMEGVRRLADLVNKGAIFDNVYIQSQLLAAVWHVLQRPFKLHSLNAHDPLPGYGQQGLHADWGGERGTGQYHVVNSMWMLDDVTPGNGATRLVPGSHLLTETVHDATDDPLARHPDEVYLCAPAGSVGIFNGNAWHGCTHNRSTSASRRLLHCAFIAREHAQQTNQKEYLRAESAARISPLAKYVLDV